MASRQIDPEARQARRQREQELIGKLKAGIAQRALFDKGSLWDFDIDDLAYELEGMRRHLRRTLSAPNPRGLGRENGNALEASLFGSDRAAVRQVLDARRKELQQLKVDRTVEKAVKIHYLIQRAREVLPEIEAARREHWAREKAEREAAFAARVIEAQAAGAKLEYGRDEVRDLIQERTGETYYDYGSAASLYGDAARHGVFGDFADVICGLAAERYGSSWHYAGD
jgi:hypothetical protein